MSCVLDKKTGKVMPWTALQTAAYTLLDTPVDFVEEGHLYHKDGRLLDSVTYILGAEGFIDCRWYTEEGRDRGREVHLITYLDDTGELLDESVSDAIRPYLDAWRRFRRETGFDVERSEIHMMSSVYQFAGTPDVIGHFPTEKIKRAAVELHNDGTYRLIPYTDRQDVNIWLSVLAVHNWKKNNLKGV